MDVASRNEDSKEGEREKYNANEYLHKFTVSEPLSSLKLKLNSVALV
jgi:hypothetical protein